MVGLLLLTPGSSSGENGQPPDDLIIIEEEDGGNGGQLNDNDLIIIEDEPHRTDTAAERLDIATEPEQVRWKLPLAADFASMNGSILARGSVSPNLTGKEDPWRGTAQGRFVLELKPDSPWRAHMDARVRGQGRAALMGSDFNLATSPTVTANSFATRGFAELGEAYVSLRVPKGTFSIGRQLFNWTRTEIARFGDVINPIDPREGPLFSTDSRQPVLAVAGRVLLGRIAVQGVWTPVFEPPFMQFFASDQQAVSPFQPSFSLAASPEQIGAEHLTRVYGDAREAIVGPRTDTSTAEFALRASGTAAGVDLGAQVFLGYDRMPKLLLSPAESVALGMASSGAVPGAVSQHLNLNCSGAVAGDCPPMQRRFPIEFQRTVIGQIDGATTLGPAVLKIELMAAPVSPILPGATVHLIDATTQALHSGAFSKLAAAIAVESGYGEWLQASVELVDIAYLDIPAGVRIANLEPTSQAVDSNRTVHRLAFAIALHGSLFDRDLSWHCLAFASPVQMDYAVTPRIVYRTLFGQELALGVEFLGGPPGTFGRFHEAASRLYVEWNLSF